VGEVPLKAEPRDEASREAADLLNALVDRARVLLKDEQKANMLLVRGIDDYQPLPSFDEIFKLTPLCIATYPMYRGVAKLVGMQLKDVPSSASITDQFTALEEVWQGDSQFDYIFFHIKKTDSAGEDGNYGKKVHVLEDLDEQMPRLLALKPDVIVVTGDHSTPSQMKSHSWHPLPTLIWGANVRVDLSRSFGESEAATGALGHLSATEIMPLAMAHAGKLLKFGA
jgi:2,3-bisphosphoglycerate-independent phosphoglycerate mutase